MYSLAEINALNNEATLESIEDEREPEEFTSGTPRVVSDDFKIPYIGYREVEGWEETENHYFVDSSGFGQPGERALTQEEFLQEVREGYGYGVIEFGQFQVYVQEYERTY